MAYTKTLDEELMPMLAEARTLSHRDNDNHPSVVWLCKWLSQPERRADEILHVVVPLKEKMKDLLEQFAHQEDENSNRGSRGPLSCIGWQLRKSGLGYYQGSR